MVIGNVRVIYCFIVCSVMAYHVAAQDVVWIDEQFSQNDWREFAKIWADTVNDENFNQIKSVQNIEFSPLNKSGISFTPAAKIYWVKFTYFNTTKRAIPLLLSVSNPLINRIRVYTEHIDGTVHKSKISGDHYPFKHREIKHRNFLFSLQAPAREPITCYVFLDKFGESMALPAILYRQSAFIEAEQKEMLLLLGYFGFMFTFIFLAGLAAFFSGRKMYVYFFIYVISATLSQVSVTGIGYQFLWPSFPAFSSVSGYSFSSLSILGMLALTRSFFSTKFEFPRIDLFIIAIMSLAVCFWPVFFFYSHIPAYITMVLIPIGHLIIFGYCIVVVIVPILNYFKYHQKDSIWFLFAFGFSLLGILIHNLEIFDVLDYSLLTNYALRAGLALDVFVLALLLGNKIRNAFMENQRISQQLDFLRIEAANALLEGQQLERQRLSQDLHDGISLSLATIRMRLSNVQYSLRGKTEYEALSPIIMDTGKVAEDVRKFTHALSPVNFDNQTLAESIEDMIYNLKMASSALTIETFVDKTLEISDFVKYAIYQTTQELLTNVIKHADATRIVLKVEEVNKKICLTVEDNGSGFEPAAIDHKGIGMKNVQARATLLKGTLNVKSPNGGGCKVEFLIPNSSK